MEFWKSATVRAELALGLSTPPVAVGAQVQYPARFGWSDIWRCDVYVFTDSTMSCSLA